MMVLYCGCAGVNGKTNGALYQDDKHGNGNRVHTPTRKGDGGERKYRCSICGTERQKGGVSVGKPKK